MSRLAPGEGRASRPLTEHYWETQLRAADTLAVAYGDRYRSSYVWIGALAFLALAGAGLSTMLPHGLELALVGGEVLALALIGALVFLNFFYSWHEKWISYRLLAELCRKQHILTALGRTLRNAEVLRISADLGDGAHAPPHDLWVAWCFLATSRAAPFPLGSLAVAKPEALALARDLCEEQIAYHQSRGARNHKANKRIAEFGEGCFAATLAFGALKLASTYEEAGTLVGLSGAIGAALSAASGAFVGLRAYSEFSLLARQSAHMLRVLKATQAELAALSIDEPRSGEELGRIMTDLTESMMQDVTGWAQLFRIKTLEAGG
jgi:hypothetical protein